MFEASFCKNTPTYIYKYTSSGYKTPWHRVCTHPSSFQQLGSRPGAKLIVIILQKQNIITGSTWSWIVFTNTIEANRCSLHSTCVSSLSPPAFCANDKFSSTIGTVVSTVVSNSFDRPRHFLTTSNKQSSRWVYRMYSASDTRAL